MKVVFGFSVLLAASCLIGRADASAWGVNLYVPEGSADSYLSDWVFKLAADMGVTYIVLWQTNFNEHVRSVSKAQLVDAVHRMKAFGLKPIVDLEYDVDEAVALVSALGSDCMMYEVGKEPHVAGTDASASVSEYVSYWNQIVTACRKVNPNAMYGGPAVGSPPTSPSNSPPYLKAYLQQCDGDFLSVHSFPGGSTRSEAISMARTRTVSDMQQLKALMAEYGKEVPILFTEVQWNSAVTSNGWDVDKEFNDAWTTSLMTAMQEQNVSAACFWVLMGYDNNFAILKPPSKTYTCKP